MRNLSRQRIRRTMSKQKTNEHHWDFRPAEYFKFNDDEMFNMYMTFSKVAAVNLKELREKAPGVPSYMCDRNGKEISIYEGRKRWHKVLDKMIYSFSELSGDNRHEPPRYETVNGEIVESRKHINYWKKINKGLDLFREHFLSLVMY